MPTLATVHHIHPTSCGESTGLRPYLLFAWNLMKASVEAFTAFMEASMEDMESMEASIWKQLKRRKLP